MRTPPKVFCLIYVVIAGVAGCANDSASPDHESGDEPGINIVAGAGVTDTVDTVLPLALRVVVRDNGGKILSGAVVRFVSVPGTQSNGGNVPIVYVGGLGAPGVSTFAADTTSAEGVAFVRIVLGRGAGVGAVAIEVPQAGLSDTAHYTIKPGAPARVVLPVTDTTIEVAHALTLNGRVEDRYGNHRSEAVKYEVSGTGLTISSAQVNANAPARAAVIGQLEGVSTARDTTWISVVPVATIAATRGNKLVTAALDGTSLTEIPLSISRSYDAEWHPNGQSLLAGLGSNELYQVWPNGTTRQILGAAAGASVPGHLYEFTYSPDGQWVYVSAGSCNYASILYRARVANAQAIERLSPTGLDECFELVNHSPSLSPDGTRLVYENQTWNQSGYSIRVMTISSKSITEIVPGGQRPRWSPAGDLIAYWRDNQIWVVNPDGISARAVSPAGHSYVPGVQWSPDGKWILARFSPVQNWAGTTVALINVNTGVEIPLPWTTGYGIIGLPTWKP